MLSLQDMLEPASSAAAATAARGTATDKDASARGGNKELRHNHDEGHDSPSRLTTTTTAPISTTAHRPSHSAIRTPRHSTTTTTIRPAPETAKPTPYPNPHSYYRHRASPAPRSRSRSPSPDHSPDSSGDDMHPPLKKRCVRPPYSKEQDDFIRFVRDDLCHSWDTSARLYNQFWHPSGAGKREIPGLQSRYYRLLPDPVRERKKESVGRPELGILAKTQRRYWWMVGAYEDSEREETPPEGGETGEEAWRDMPLITAIRSPRPGSVRVAKEIRSRMRFGSGSGSGSGSGGSATSASSLSGSERATPTGRGPERGAT
ncbi:hypothetical protein EDC01DRAFT_434218 [Geopyxis carbonaria]|nr:hypothetical protein EDC01DRAFT_434218 [Geopyxis carbonaria]